MVELNIEEVEFRQAKLLNILEANISYLKDSDNKILSILDFYLDGFVNEELELESVCALKSVIDELVDDFDIELEVLVDKIVEMMNERMGYESQIDYANINNENSGYIYIMINPSMSGVIKIGLTRRSPEERMEELSRATGVPTPFILVYKEYFNDCIHAEKIIHSILSERGERVSNNREFFHTETSEAIKVVQGVKESEESIQGSDNIDIELFEDKPLSETYLEKGLDYLNGYGDCLQDLDKAEEYLMKAGELGEARAYYDLGMFYLAEVSEENLIVDIKKVINYFEKGRQLNGKYANYCNAGLAMCYANDRIHLYKTKNYHQNDSNAEKCWEWFFDNVNFNDGDYMIKYHTLDCLVNFMNNDEVSSIYKDKLESKFMETLKKCRYVVYDSLKEFSFYERERQFLFGRLEKYQLDRKVKIKCIWDDVKKTGERFKVLMEEGYLENEDYLSFDAHEGAYRVIQKLEKNGQEVSRIEQGETGTIYVSDILKDLPYYQEENLSITVVGNNTLEKVQEQITGQILVEDIKDSETRANKKGLIGRLKGWFN